MISFLSDTKIDTVNIKFATSIMNETIKRLTLLHSAESNENEIDKDNENIETDKTKSGDIGLRKFGTDVNNIKRSLKSVVSQLELYQNFADFSGISVAENESSFLDEYSQNKSIFDEQSVIFKELEELIASHHMPTATVDVSLFKNYSNFSANSKIQKISLEKHYPVCHTK